MGMARIAVLVVAAIAAGAAALLMRNLVSDDGAANANAPASIIQMPTTQVLVAAEGIERGETIDPTSLRWQPWPEDAISPAYISMSRSPNALEDAKGSIVRTPLNAGEPITLGKIVKTGDTGFMSAVLQPGMRAVSTKISPETGAGGFILPDDRVDVLLTQKTRGNSGVASTKTFLKNVRVLAIGQTYRETEDKNKVVIGKTATLELSPGQAESLMQNKALGTISLALRSLTDSGPNAQVSDAGYGGSLRIYRYGKESSVTVGSSQ